MASRAQSMFLGTSCAWCTVAACLHLTPVQLKNPAGHSHKIFFGHDPPYIAATAANSVEEHRAKVSAFPHVPHVDLHVEGGSAVEHAPKIADSGCVPPRDVPVESSGPFKHALESADSGCFPGTDCIDCRHVDGFSSAEQACHRAHLADVPRSKDLAVITGKVLISTVLHPAFQLTRAKVLHTLACRVLECRAGRLPRSRIASRGPQR
eukprot:742962-Rhodomonas_salina.2